MLGGGQLGRFFVHRRARAGLPRRRCSTPIRTARPAASPTRHLVARLRRCRRARRDWRRDCAAVTHRVRERARGSAGLPGRSSSRCARPPTRVAIAPEPHQREDASSATTASRSAPLRRDPRRATTSSTPMPALFPGVLKVEPLRLRRQGPGAGRQRRRGRRRAWPPLRAASPACWRQLLPLDCEVSVRRRARRGRRDARAFPVAENSHRDGILDVSASCRRGCRRGLRAAAEEMAAGLAAELDYVGVLGVEFFVSRRARCW
ncbi:MAG: ATP-grasp domain-containing protein [Comamonadaceae bacterium]|nr:ATP-grasp domain-containing protein [Comamonadaceae bacterium]